VSSRVRDNQAPRRGRADQRGGKYVSFDNPEPSTHGAWVRRRRGMLWLLVAFWSVGAADSLIVDTVHEDRQERLRV